MLFNSCSTCRIQFKKQYAKLLLSFTVLHLYQTNHISKIMKLNGLQKKTVIYNVLQV